MAITYNEIFDLIHSNQLSKAEAYLHEISSRNDKWHFFYSQLMMKKSWFNLAKDHLEQAITLNPTQSLYQKSLTQLMSRSSSYSRNYYRRGRGRNNHCVCCCDCCDCGCCRLSCCDLICLDSLCECMGGDLIECI